jgi:hypothetical protein
MERGRMGSLCSRACGSFVIVFPLVGQLYLIMMDHSTYVRTERFPNDLGEREQERT